VTVTRHAKKMKVTLAQPRLPDEPWSKEKLFAVSLTISIVLFAVYVTVLHRAL
jgi:hypothetical protein